MNISFSSAAIEMPVSDIHTALEYYGERLGFSIDWVRTEEAASPVCPRETAGFF